MKSEQIAELRRHAEMQEACIEGMACGHTDELVQLLDEREALLAALKKLTEHVDGVAEVVCPDGGAEAIRDAHTAIEKAET